MFSQKKRFYEKKSFYFAMSGVFLFLISFGIWFNFDENPILDANISQNDTAVSTSKQNTNDREEKNQEGKTTPSGMTNENFVPYYFAVEEDGYVKLYYFNQEEEKKFIRTSDITFDLLGEEDQLLFRDGIRLNTEEELSELLQDFES